MGGGLKQPPPGKHTSGTFMSSNHLVTTTPCKVEQEKKNFTMKLPVVNDKGGVS